MTNDIGKVGTLAELGVKEGDVVEHLYFLGGDAGWRSVEVKGPVTHGMYSEDGWYTTEGGILIGEDKIRIISRASEEPKTWGRMTDEEKGALLLAKHEGKVVQALAVDHTKSFWARKWGDMWHNETSYRIKPEPVVKTVVMNYIKGQNSMSTHTHRDDTHRITFNTIDGEPALGSIKMSLIENRAGGKIDG